MQHVAMHQSRAVADSTTDLLGCVTAYDEEPQ